MIAERDEEPLTDAAALEALHDTACRSGDALVDVPCIAEPTESWARETGVRLVWDASRLVCELAFEAQREPTPGEIASLVRASRTSCPTTRGGSISNGRSRTKKRTS